MGTGSINRSDVFHLNNIVQNTMLSHSKEVFIETLRDTFNSDSYFHYVRDEWGFPKTPDHTDLDSKAGLHDDVTTRLFIGEAFHYDMIYYPAILIRAGAFRYVPISMSRNEELVHYKITNYIDGYGNQTFVNTPDYFDLAGAWEGQIIIDILAGDLQARDELVDLVSAVIQIARFHEFKKAGVFIKPINIGTPSESDDNNDKIYKTSITCDVRTEWRQQIPIDSVIDSINFCVDFGDLSKKDPVLAVNLEIKTTLELIQTIQDL